MVFLITNIILLLMIIFLFILLSWVWPPDSPWAPWWKTNKKTARAMCRLAKINKNDIVYDLGSGDGTALIVASREFEVKGVGVEIDPLRAFISTLMIRINRVQGKIKIIRKNFYDVDISRASVVFVYLVPKALNRLLPKFRKELKPGTKIISYRYKMNLPLKDQDEKNQLMLYII